jgi:beta-N-acetylhexosaminidase
MARSAVIFGPEGTAVTRWERAFFREVNPWGFILFARNVDTPDQMRRLTGDLRDVLGRQAPILIDQEGGRVQRMRPPHWRAFLPALEQMTRARDPVRAQWLRNRLIAADLHDVGVDVNCAPLADLVEEGTHPVLLNRLYGSDVGQVIRAARAAANGLKAGGVLPVVKHIPGYGRAEVDSHLDLPRVRMPLSVLEDRDFAPFRGLKDIRMGMTAHIVVEALDARAPATTSVAAMSYIRDRIGFGGLIMTDDLSMQALSGSLADRARASLAAGVDLVLHCNGKPDDMTDVMQGMSPMTDAAIQRAEAALAERQPPDDSDLGLIEAELQELLETAE